MPKRSKGPMSTAYRKPIVLYSDDPRASNKKELKKYKSKIGAEVIVKDAPLDNVVLEDYPIPTSYWIQTVEFPSIITSASSYKTQVVSNSNSIWYIENTTASTDSNPSTKITKFNLNGDILWQKKISHSQHIYIYGAKVNLNGTLYIVGQTKNTLGRPHGFVARLNTLGDFVWQKKIDIGIPNGNAVNTITDIDLDSSDNIYMIINHYVPAYNSIYKADIIKLDKNGSDVWHKSISAVGRSFNRLYANGIKVDLEDNIYITADDDPDVAVDLYITKINKDGNFIWQKRITTCFLSRWQTIPLGIDSSNNLLIGATSRVIFLGQNRDFPSIIKFDKDGLLLDSKVYPHLNTSLSLFRIRDFSIDINNEIYLVYSTRTNSFSGSTQDPWSTVTKLNNSLSRIWQRDFNDNAILRGNIGVTIHDSGFIFTSLNTIQKLPKDGTKTGVYPILPSTIIKDYKNSTIYGSEITPSYTQTTTSYTIATTQYFTISSHDASIQNTQFIPAIVRI